MDLFAPAPALPDGMTLLPGRALDPAIVAAALAVLRACPPRQMLTPHGPMSAALSACGPCGWVADSAGYRYTSVDPRDGAPWPPLPATLAELAGRCAAEAGFAAFVPDTCLLNVYAPGSKMGIHRDADEVDFSHPIVSVSLGIPATFIIATSGRQPNLHLPLHHGDVLVFGGPARRCRHGVARIRHAAHPELGARRINLTFRRAR